MPFVPTSCSKIAMSLYIIGCVWMILSLIMVSSTMRIQKSVIVPYYVLAILLGFIFLILFIVRVLTGHHADDDGHKRPPPPPQPKIDQAHAYLVIWIISLIFLGMSAIFYTLQVIGRSAYFPTLGERSQKIQILMTLSLIGGLACMIRYLGHHPNCDPVV